MGAEALAHARRALAQGQPLQAVSLCRESLGTNPGDIDVWRLLCRASLAGADLDTAREAARQAIALRPRNVQLRLRLAWVLWVRGELGEALQLAGEIERSARGKAGASARAGAWYERTGQLDAAWRCCLRAMERAPDDARWVTAAARVAAARGDAERAGSLCERAIFLQPGEGEAWFLRSRLRRHTADENHVHQIGYALDRLDPDDPQRAPLCYALAWELEDLGHDEAAFGMMREGARCLEADREPREAPGPAACAAAERSFDRRWLQTRATGEDGQGWVFLVGQPGSGLALLERLLTSAEGTLGLGDSGQWNFLVARSVGPHQAWDERLRRAATLAPEALARTWLATLRPLSDGARWMIDRSRENVLYAAQIQRALPRATLVYLRRDPLDSCLAQFRALPTVDGRAGMPDLAAIGRRHAAFHALMGHWRRHLVPGFLEVDYERLVSEPGAVLEQIRTATGLPVGDADHCGLERFQAGVGRWRRHEANLAGLASQLREDGVPVG